MRPQIFSDLHADVARPRPIAIAPEVDGVIATGDVCEGAENAFTLLRQIVPMQVPIVMVKGNHEFYRRCWSEELAQVRAAAPLFAVHLHFRVGLTRVICNPHRYGAENGRFDPALVVEVGS